MIIITKDNTNKKHKNVIFFHNKLSFSRKSNEKKIVFKVRLLPFNT